MQALQNEVVWRKTSGCVSLLHHLETQEDYFLNAMSESFRTLSHGGSKVASIITLELRSKYCVRLVWGVGFLCKHALLIITL